MRRWKGLNPNRSLGRLQLRPLAVVPERRGGVAGAGPCRRPAVLLALGRECYRLLTMDVPFDSLFSTMLNGIYYETLLLGEVADQLRRRLPPDWSLERLGQKLSSGPGGSRVDAVLALTDPRGESATIIVEAKGQPLEARMVNSLLHQSQRLLDAGIEVSGTDGSRSFMVISPFLGPAAKERLADAGISYADATGNMRFVTSRPAVFIETEGAVRNPWRENAPLRSLQGRRSARVVRAFLDYRPSYGTRELAALSGNAPASISRVAELLERDAIIERAGPRGAFVSVDWKRLLYRWAVDYDFSLANRMVPCLEPRGLPRLFEKLREAEFGYAVTGSFAGNRYAALAEPRLATVYVADLGDAMNRLELRPADTGGNVLIGQPFDPVVFDRTEREDSITYARVTQVAADLMTGPGRGPAEAEGLIEWMKVNEEAWRLSSTQAT